MHLVYYFLQPLLLLSKTTNFYQLLQYYCFEGAFSLGAASLGGVPGCRPRCISTSWRSGDVPVRVPIPEFSATVGASACSVQGLCDF